MIGEARVLSSPTSVDFASRRRREAAEVIALGSVLLATRVVTALLMAGLTHGREFTDDIHIYLQYAAHPLSRLSGTVTSPPYPPLQGILDAISLGVLRPIIGDFLAVRVGFSLFEAIALMITMLSLRTLGVEARTRRGLALVMILAPVGWMSGAVMAQEESIGMAFAAAAILAEAHGRRSVTLMLLSLAVVTAKAFFIFPLCVLFLASPNLPVKQRLLWGATPLAVTYGTMAVWMLHAGRTAEHFALPVFGVNIWRLTQLLVPLSERFCARGAAVAIGLGMLAICWRARRTTTSPAQGIAGLSAALGASFLFFYHANPEYYEMLLPSVVVLFPSIRAASTLALLLSIPWSTNFVDGVANAARLPTEGGKATFVDLYFKWIAIAPERISPIALGASVVAILLVLAMFVRFLRASALRASGSESAGSLP
jgi:hypothetical protein